MPRACHVFVPSSSDCYLPLFRQFSQQRRGGGPAPAIESVLSAASVLQFSGGAYYHWLLEALPRLLLLRTEVSRLIAAGQAPADTVLLVPSLSPFVLESLALLFPHPDKPAPFSRILPVGPDSVLAVQQHLFYVDWQPPAPGAHEEDSSAQVGGWVGRSDLWEPASKQPHP